eukprot:gene8893-biopygen3171
MWADAGADLGRSGQGYWRVYPDLPQIGSKIWADLPLTLLTDREAVDKRTRDLTHKGGRDREHERTGASGAPAAPPASRVGRGSGGIHDIPMQSLEARLRPAPIRINCASGSPAREDPMSGAKAGFPSCVLRAGRTPWIPPTGTRDASAAVSPLVRSYEPRYVCGSREHNSVSKNWLRAETGARQ